MNGKAEVHKDSYPRDYLTDVIRYFEQNHKMIKYFELLEKNNYYVIRIRNFWPQEEGHPVLEQGL